MRRIPWIILVVMVGCSSGGETVGVGGEDVVDSRGGDSGVEDLRTADMGIDSVTVDVVEMLDFGPGPEVDAVEPACAPGEGCFLDPCEANDDCQSGWCVQHLGERVCTQTCQTECPPGWECLQVAGTDPDLVYVCVSRYANLCRPCATNADCTSTGGASDACIDYGPTGSFCGGACGADGACPWGFACQEVTTVEGSTLDQCVNETGDCPCTDSSVALGLTTPCEITNEFGTCQGKRTCAENGLSACDAATPAEETCNGLDDDCDGETDEPSLVAGDYVNLCDDGNDCTADQCLGADGCLNEVLDGTACNDENPCSVADHCDQGTCIGDPVECDDENPCTDNVCTDTGGCEYPPNSDSCDDENPCTLADRCVDGTCIGTQMPCECFADEDCADLEDGDLCNGTLVCNLDKLPHQCVVDPATVITCPDPEGDHAICLQAVCDPDSGECGTAPDHEGFACTDHDACTTGDQCTQGACTPTGAPDCDDSNPCTDDSCDPQTGCIHVANSAPCDDLNACTTGDTCQDKQCVPGEALDCDDSNPCTTDSCTPGGGCTYKMNAAPCDDGDLCTTGDHCELGECTSSGSLPCDDSNLCTDDSCNPLTGCQFKPNSAPCDDGSVCTGQDQCAGGWCKPGALIDCDDSNPCTDDACDPLSGCTHTPNDAPCSDGDACTTDDVCQAGACTAGPALDCNDDNPCTSESCQPKSGCVYVTLAGDCDDGNACTDGDACVDGKCQPGAPLTCNDENGCTDDACLPETGCVFTPNAEPCDDGDDCTAGDTCITGACQPGEPLVCDDANVCTEDSCLPQGGCTFQPVADGTPCGPQSTCIEGVCTQCGDLHGSATFNFTGTVQSFVVPDCITTVTLELWGAQGGDSTGGKIGGKGGYAKGDLTVTPGETLSVYVGGEGGNSPGAPGGWNGGGPGSESSVNKGGGGGGGTDVRQGGATLDHRVIVAGGGGGGYNTSNPCIGGSGGGESGTSPTCGGGAQPGTQTGTGCCGDAGFGIGGSNHGYGGGGGGWWGGGSADGCCAGAGAGGSGYVGGVSNGTMDTGVRSGPGMVVVTW